MKSLRERREQAGLSQLKLAERSGVKQSVISDIEAGKTKNPRVDTAAQIATALGCTIDDLFGTGGTA